MSHFLGIITRKYFISTHLYCKTSFALHMTFYASRSIHIVLLFRFLLFLRWILISFQDPVKGMKIDELNVQNEAYDQSDEAWQHKWVTFWHKIYYIDSFVLQNLICSACDSLCFNRHYIAFQISYISASHLNWFPRFCKCYVIWMRWVYKMKHMISQIRPGSTNESLLWHNYKKIFYFDSFVLQNLICTAYHFLCLKPHYIAFQISYISASHLNWFPRFCKSYVI